MAANDRFDLAHIRACAQVILNLCEDEGDERTKLKRISYAAAIIKRETDVGLEQLNSSMEESHA